MGHDPGGFRLRGGGSDATLDNAHVAEDYLARTTTMYRIIAVADLTLRKIDFFTGCCDASSFLAACPSRVKNGHRASWPAATGAPQKPDAKASNR
jgi:hypothetical protein